MWNCHAANVARHLSADDVTLAKTGVDALAEMEEGTVLMQKSTHVESGRQRQQFVGPLARFAIGLLLVLPAIFMYCGAALGGLTQTLSLVRPWSGLLGKKGLRGVNLQRRLSVPDIAVHGLNEDIHNAIMHNAETDGVDSTSRLQMGFSIQAEALKKESTLHEQQVVASRHDGISDIVLDTIVRNAASEVAGHTSRLQMGISLPAEFWQ